MARWDLLDQAAVPGGGGELFLYRRGDEFSIRADGQELMNSRVHGSEEELAERVCVKMSGRLTPRILIGGLGMGFTLAAALPRLNADARVDVAELVPAVVAWCRGPLAHLTGPVLQDRRVTIHEVDIIRLLRGMPRAFDAIILDVDNGPAGLTRKENDWLYGRAGSRALCAALRPRGVLAVWSAGPDPAYRRRLQQTGFAVEELPVRARRGHKGGHHLIWLATAPA
jgi:spermidine synthase